MLEFLFIFIKMQAFRINLSLSFSICELCVMLFRNSPSEAFLGKGVLKICRTFTGEYPYRSVISIKLLCKFIEIPLQHGCSPVNLLYIFRTPYYKNTSGGLLLTFSLWLLTGKKHRQIKLQRLQKVRIWTFGQLVHQLNSL